MGRARGCRTYGRDEGQRVAPDRRNSRSDRALAGIDRALSLGHGLLHEVYKNGLVLSSGEGTISWRSARTTSSSPF